MYDIRQFKPALYVVILMGITGFAMASLSPGLWLLAVVAVVFNGWLLMTDRFTPLPRLVANLATLIAFAWAMLAVLHTHQTPIIGIGNFLVLLQLVKIYEQRANRDYAQLLVLSLLLMVAAAINTASLAFGILFIAYLFISLYCCLLFHLKVEADNAQGLMLGTETRPNPHTLRQDQTFLPRSMRRLTGLISTVAICFAILVFLFFPRGTGAGLLRPLQMQMGQPMTGFSEQLGYNQVARITQNNELVAYVSVWENDQPVESGELLLRGLTFDRYTGEGDGRSGPWQWERTGEPEPLAFNIPRMTFTVLDSRPSTNTIRQQWTFVRPPTTSVLFALGGISAISGDREMRLRYSPYSQTITVPDPPERPMEYTVISSGQVTQPRLSLRTLESFLGRSAERRESRIAPEVAEYARQPEVSGRNADGPLYEQRPVDAYTHSLDLDIARAIEAHLRDTFAYTLDLTDTRRTPGEDPMIGFLTEYRRGHCEYFAGAMTLMCQSLGLQARMVVGFKTNEYNDWENRFVVRQAHAHAWVEVLSPEGVWVTFDPTSGNDPRFQRETTLWGQVKHLFDFLEHKWANSVVAYDAESRANLISQVDQTLTNTAVTGNTWLTQFKNWLDEKLFWTVSSKLLGALLWSMGAGVLVAIGWFLYERWKLKRRAERIGLDVLPGSERLRLVRQLGFYDDLMRLLNRHEIERPPHLTPMEFAESLSYLPVEAYHGIRRLTQIFYRIRYGRATLQVAQRRRLQAVLLRISESIDPSTDKA